MTLPDALRVARYAEVVYALVAVVLAFGLPWPPRGQGIVLFSHWMGTALLAAALALRLRRPNRQTWYIAALLSGYVLFNAAVAVLRLVAAGAGNFWRPTALALAVGGLLWITQAVVAICLYYAREVRTTGDVAARRR